jgi:DNA primase
VTPTQIEEYQLGYCSEGQYSGRVIIPSVWEGRTEFFMARDIEGKSRSKYLAPEGGKGGSVFNLSKATACPGPIVVCEGALGAIHVGPNAVATFGKEATAQQARRIAEHTTSVVVLYDQGAEVHSWKLAEKLHRLDVPDVRIATCPGPQPDESSHEEIRKALEKAQRYEKMDHLLFNLGASSEVANTCRDPLSFVPRPRSLL